MKLIKDKQLKNDYALLHPPPPEKISLSRYWAQADRVMGMSIPWY
jgi:hypothetical protein